MVLFRNLSVSEDRTGQLRIPDEVSGRSAPGQLRCVEIDFPAAFHHRHRPAGLPTGRLDRLSSEPPADDSVLSTDE